MQIQIGKSYKIVGEVSKGHGKCNGSIITCVGFDRDGDPVFDGLTWNGNFGEYLLVPDSVMSCSSERYNSWLSSVIEAI